MFIRSSTVGRLPCSVGRRNKGIKFNTAHCLGGYNYISSTTPLLMVMVFSCLGGYQLVSSFTIMVMVLSCSCEYQLVSSAITIYYSHGVLMS